MHTHRSKMGAQGCAFSWKRVFSNMRVNTEQTRITSKMWFPACSTIEFLRLRQSTFLLPLRIPYSTSRILIKLHFTLSITQWGGPHPCTRHNNHAGWLLASGSDDWSMKKNHGCLWRKFWLEPTPKWNLEYVTLPPHLGCVTGWTWRRCQLLRRRTSTMVIKTRSWVYRWLYAPTTIQIPFHGTTTEHRF